ncbi:MAG: anti-sigma factor [Pseudomonadota bacterium]
MITNEEKLSAFLDGELSDEESRQIEAALTDDPRLQEQLEALMAVDAAVKDEFAAMLEEPVPLNLAASVQNATLGSVANDVVPPSRRPWMSMAAAVALLAVGGTVGYVVGTTPSAEVVVAASWLDDIADYHRVYSGQKRHLVEVGAEDPDHIQTWLTASIGADVRIPDLSTQGLRFQGARLLVAAGKPVSQLMYTDGDGRVVALCQIQTQTPRDGRVESVIGGFELVSWGGEASNFVVIGDQDRGDLTAIAQAAAEQV